MTKQASQSVSPLELASQIANSTGIRFTLPATVVTLDSRAADVVGQAGVLRRTLQLATQGLPDRLALVSDLAALPDSAARAARLRDVLGHYALAYAATELLLRDEFWSGPLSVPEVRIVVEVLSSAQHGPSPLRLYGVYPDRIHPDLTAHALARVLRDALLDDRARVLDGFLLTGADLTFRQSVSAAEWHAAITRALTERLRG